ncbi:DMT family transporter [Ruminococcus sp.]|uniref:DMT family transporter n=1 Tax=Ruminococcus sp. TaxID=41978 RepID=UPI002588FDF7|nr:DMT family transporter [Ruminococcus sp.]
MKNLKGSIMLIITALIWGTAFVAQSKGMDYIGPFTYNALRTLLGGIVLIPVIALFRRSKSTQKNTPSKTTVKGGILCGTVLFAASSLQQAGISMTTAGKAGFVTALYIIIVPVLGLFLGKRPRPVIWICAAGALAGFYLLCIKEDFAVSGGDLLVLAGAVFFAVHIMVIDKFNDMGADGMVMACLQFFTAGTIMLICMFIFEKPVLSSISDAKLTILYTGIMSCGVAYTLQILGQRQTEPARATMLMSLESVFAALSGWVILNEKLSPREICGCALVFSAVLAAQLLSADKKAE